MIQLQPDFFVAFDLYPTFSNCTLNPAMVFLGFKVSPCFALHLGSRCQACPLALRPPQRPSPMVAGASNRSCWESNIKPPIGSICWWFLEPIYGKFGGGSYCFTHIYTHIYIYILSMWDSPNFMNYPRVITIFMGGYCKPSPNGSFLCCVWHGPTVHSWCNCW